jgi:hypothetical protein
MRRSWSMSREFHRAQADAGRFPVPKPNYRPPSRGCPPPTAGRSGRRWRRC